MNRTLLLASAAIAGTLVSVASAGAQTPFDWTGLYIGAHAGYLNGNVKLSEDISPGGGNISGAIGGVLAGYNFANLHLPFLLGVEADAGFADVQGNGTTICVSADCANTFHYDLEWDAHFRVRAGTPMGNFMPFVAGGLALAAVNITEDGSLLWDNVYTGATVGAGVDAKLAPGFIGRAEVLYDFYPTAHHDEYTIDLSALTARVALIYRLP